LQDLPKQSNVYCCLTCKYCNLNLKKPHMQCGWPCIMWITKYDFVCWGLGYHICMWGNNTHWFFGSILQYSHGSHKKSTGFFGQCMQYLSTSWAFASMIPCHSYIKITQRRINTSNQKNWKLRRFNNCFSFPLLFVYLF